MIGPKFTQGYCLVWANSNSPMLSYNASHFDPWYFLSAFSMTRHCDLTCDCLNFFFLFFKFICTSFFFLHCIWNVLCFSCLLFLFFVRLLAISLFPFFLFFWEKRGRGAVECIFLFRHYILVIILSLSVYSFTFFTFFHHYATYRQQII